MTSPPQKNPKRARRPRKQYTYRHRTNAIHITLHSMTGETVPTEVREQFKELATRLALENGLVVNIATT